MMLPKAYLQRQAKNLATELQVLQVGLAAVGNGRRPLASLREMVEPLAALADATRDLASAIPDPTQRGEERSAEIGPMTATRTAKHIDQGDSVVRS